MNFKRQAKQLEQFLEEEFKNKTPLALLGNGAIAYGNIIIKQNKRKEWQLNRTKGQVLDTFNTKSAALIAAKLYNSSNFQTYGELKVLDQLYFKNFVDSEIYKHKFKTAKDGDRRDLYLARFLESEQHATYARKQIASKFKMMF